MSSPEDPLELEADAVAARVVPGGVGRRSAPLGDADSGVLARRGGPATGAGRARPEVSPRVESLVSAPGPGSPVPPAVRARIEPELATDLGAVRVHTGPEAQAAASSLQARAFTTGRHVFLGAGESPHDVGLMAHEATHVVQQGGGLQRLATPLQREAEEDEGLFDVDVTGWIKENLAGAAGMLPGYTMLGQVLGRDPITGRPVRAPQQEWLESLLTWGEAAFGPAVGPVLSAAEVLGDVVALVAEELEARDLTFSRLERDLAGAWEEFEVLKGVSGNLEILDRYLDALLADVGAFVAAIADRVIAAVRAVVAELVAPLLESEAVRPVWSLATKVFHHDPLRGTEVTVPTVEILAEFLTLIGQEEALGQLQENGALVAAAEWLDTQWTAFTSILDETGRLFTAAWDAISPQNLPGLLDTLPGLVERGIGLVGQVLDFGGTLLGKALELVKDALLGALSAHAHELPGFHLLTVILEQNPFTGEAVARTAENLIRGFLTLVEGGEQTYQQLAESGVIADAAARITGEMGRLGISVAMITETFLGVWDTLSLEDLLSPVEAFERVLERFGEPLSRLVEFVGVVVEVLITLVLQIMDFPSDLLASILDKISQSVDRILADPVGFLVNMVEALKTGFSGFLDNVVTYLVQGLGDWLFRGLGQLGISLPPDLSPASILDLVLQVLGLGVETLWHKLGEHIGEENVERIRGGLDALGGAWDFLKDVQERGLAAIWDYVADRLSGLWDSLLDMARDWIVTEIVQAAAARLLQMLDPSGIMAVVNSVRAFIAAVQSVIEYVRDILQIVDRYVSTFAAVAAGDIAPGAAMLEQGLAAAIPVAIGFLANQAGIGNVPEKIVEIIQGLRELVDQALDWLFEQAMRLGRAALNALGAGADGEEDLEHDAAVAAGLAALDAAERAYLVDGRISRENAVLVADSVRQEHPVFTSLSVIDGGDSWDYAWTASPGDEHETPAKKLEGDSGTPAQRWLPESFREKGVMRRVMYEAGSGWSSLRRAINEHMHYELAGAFDVLRVTAPDRDALRVQLQQWVLVGYITAEIVEDFDASQGELNGQWLRERLEARDVSWHVDHRVPLAKHWVDKGHDSDEAERHAHATDHENNLDWMTATANLSKGSAVVAEDGETTRYHYADRRWVGPAFTSSRAEGGKLGAKTIDGEPFLDEAGNPLVS